MEIENIKFKAKRLGDGEWVEGNLLRSAVGIKKKAYIVDNFNNAVSVIPSTVCMFTGLKDKNEIPIYEGDVIIYKDNNVERRGIIDWSNKQLCFLFGCEHLSDYISGYMTVVGNKFD